MRTQDIKGEKTRAFKDGFVRGLGSPAMLFSPAISFEKESVPHIELDRVIPKKSIVNDFCLIGEDVVKALIASR